MLKKGEFLLSSIQIQQTELLGRGMPAMREIGWVPLIAAKGSRWKPFNRGCARIIADYHLRASAVIRRFTLLVLSFDIEGRNLKSSHDQENAKTRGPESVSHSPCPEKSNSASFPKRPVVYPAK